MSRIHRLPLLPLAGPWGCRRLVIGLCPSAKGLFLTVEGRSLTVED